MKKRVVTTDTLTVAAFSEGFAQQFNRSLPWHEAAVKKFEKLFPLAQRIDSDFQWDDDTIKRISVYRLSLATAKSASDLEKKLKQSICRN